MPQTTNQIIRLNFPSEMWVINVLYTTTLEVLQLIEVDEETCFEVSLAIVEAGTNAIRHGNRELANKRVCFELILQSDQITAIIGDEGDGFNRQDVLDPLAEENVYKDSGRGIWIMESYMDEVRYEQSGSVVRMTKRIRTAE